MEQALVNRIVREVLAAMNGGPDAPRAERYAGESRTGRASRPQAQGNDRLGGATDARHFLTAAMLADRIAQAASGGAVELAANEFLTPAAMDLLERKHLTVSRGAHPAPSKATPSPEIRNPSSEIPNVESAIRNPRSAMSSAGLVVARADEKVRGVLAALAHDGIRFLDFNAGGTGPGCWIVNLTALCHGLAGGKAGLGVAMLPYAADAMVLANKFAGVRAVQGTRVASVAGAIRHVGANLLVLEHRLSTFYELRAMVRAFINDRMLCGAAEDVMAAIAEVERT
ncbi:MAG: RpiB/LacA/LacB family sugar-phosphate isomerase [Phycisphaerae bacterium]